MRSSQYFGGALVALVGLSCPLAAGPIAPGTIGGDGRGVCIQVQVDTITGQAICAEVGDDGTFGFEGLDSALQLLGPAGELLGTIDSLSFGGDVDPTLGYAIGVTDFGAPSTFNIIFTMPVVSALYNFAFQTHSVSLTDGAADGASASPIGPATTIQQAFAGVTTPTTNLGVDVGGACVDAAGPPTSTACGPNELSATFAPTVFDVLQVRVAFQGSGGGDLVSMNGRADLDTLITDVPEPSASLLCGLGLIGLSLLVRRHSA